MTVEESLLIMSDVCKSVSANLETHQKIQQALQVLKEACAPPVPQVPPVQ